LLHLSVSRDFHASPQRVWQLLTDTTLWPLWGPSVRSVRCSDRLIRKGSKGKVQTPIGFWLPFIITEYDHFDFWGWKVAGIRATGHRMITSNDGYCRVVFELPYWWLPYAIVCSRAATKMAELLKRQ
jgi:hypothetical protein